MRALNKEQRKFVADFVKGLSLFFFGTVLAPLFANVDSINYSVIMLGLVDGIIFLTFGLRLLQEKKNGTDSQS